MCTLVLLLFDLLILKILEKITKISGLFLLEWISKNIIIIKRTYQNLMWFGKMPTCMDKDD